MGRKPMFETEEERKEYRLKYRREWYAKNSEAYIQKQTEWFNKKKAEDPTYQSNNERNKLYYQTHIRPLRQLVKTLQQQGLIVKAI
jgi:hypothetical protein